MVRELDTSSHPLPLLRDYAGHLSPEVWPGIPVHLWAVNSLKLRKAASFRPSSTSRGYGCCLFHRPRILLLLHSFQTLPSDISTWGWGTGSHPSAKWRRGCVRAPGYSPWLLCQAALTLHILQEPRMSLWQRDWVLSHCMDTPWQQRLSLGRAKFRSQRNYSSQVPGKWKSWGYFGIMERLWRN